MEVVILDGPSSVAELAADLVTSLARTSHGATLGLATGATPLPLYAELARRAGAGADFSRLRGVALDEYLGLAAADPRSYRHYLDRHVAAPLGLQLDTLDGGTADAAAECARYERVLAGGVQLQLLGIGATGHLGFNEPGSSLGSRTRVKTLSARTVADNARHAGGHELPRHVLTQGIGTILDAEHLVLLATGSGKAAVLRAALEGPVTSAVPASVLQLHPHVTVIVDEPAAALLALAEQHRDAYTRKPAWQGL